MIILIQERKDSRQNKFYDIKQPFLCGKISVPQFWIELQFGMTQSVSISERIDTIFLGHIDNIRDDICGKMENRNQNKYFDIKESFSGGKNLWNQVME